jgi:Short C-terminal domain
MSYSKLLDCLVRGRRAKLDKMMEVYGDTSGLADEEGIITAILKNKAEDLLEVIRNGMDRDREVYRHREQPQQQQQQSSTYIPDELMKLANLKEKGIISEDEFQQMKQDLIKKKI